MTSGKEPATMTKALAAGRPRPAVNPDTRFFWDAAFDRRLAVQRCRACRTLRHPPGGGAADDPRS